MRAEERELTRESRMARLGGSKSDNKVFSNDFSSTEDASQDLIKLEIELLKEAFQHELSVKHYIINPDDVKALQDRIINLNHEIFVRSDEGDGPWSVARHYCRIRLEEAEARELENRKQRLLNSISQSLKFVKTHDEFDMVQGEILKEVSRITGECDHQDEDNDLVKINEEITSSLAEAAVLLTNAKPVTEEEHKEILEAPPEPQLELEPEHKPDIEPKSTPVFTDADLEAVMNMFFSSTPKVTAPVDTDKELIEACKSGGKYSQRSFSKLSGEQQLKLIKLAQTKGFGINKLREFVESFQ